MEPIGKNISFVSEGSYLGNNMGGGKYLLESVLIFCASLQCCRIAYLLSPNCLPCFHPFSAQILFSVQALLKSMSSWKHGWTDSLDFLILWKLDENIIWSRMSYYLAALGTVSNFSGSHQLSADLALRFLQCSDRLGVEHLSQYCPAQCVTSFLYPHIKINKHLCTLGVEFKAWFWTVHSVARPRGAPLPTCGVSWPWGHARSLGCCPGVFVPAPPPLPLLWHPAHGHHRAPQRCRRWRVSAWGAAVCPAADDDSLGWCCSFPRGSHQDKLGWWGCLAKESKSKGKMYVLSINAALE